MALNLAALGEPIGPLRKEYTWKDAVLYALGVGAGFSEIDYCYEKDLKVIPSFAIASIFEFLTHVGVKANMNLAGILHGEQELVFHRPLPPEGILSTSGRIAHYYDKGKEKGALVVAESETRDGQGRKLFSGVLTVFARLDGGFGGPEAPKKTIAFPDREPDFAVEARPSPDQPLLYRLSGDYFQLHVDQEFAGLSGFQQPILHGLCTHGYACRALVASLIPGRPELARRMGCRFTKPLYPGIPIRTLIWKTGEGEALWRVVNAENGAVVIDHGVFSYGVPEEKAIRFDGRVALVTGAGAGLGRAYALELARRGACVVVNDLGGARDGSGAGSSAAAEAVVREIQALGGKALASGESVASPEGGRRMVDSAIAHFGRLDILINNAGILRDKTLLKMEPENWQAVIDVHLTGAYNVTRPALEAMRQNGYGRIVMTTSAAGLYGNFGQCNYAAAKMGLVGLMNALKLEADKHGIRVNTVAPIAASRLTEDVMPPDLLARSSPDFVVPMTLFLASDACTVSGRIYNAGLGSYSRAAVMTGPGIALSENGAPPSLETLAEAMPRLADLSAGREYRQLTDQLGEMLKAVETPGASSESPPQPTSVAALFAAMPAAFRPEKAQGVHAVFQYVIGGEGGGEWFCEVAEGACRIEAGRHPGPSCTLAMGAEDFLAMMDGRLPPMQAFTSGRLKISGDVLKSQLIEKLFQRRAP